MKFLIITKRRPNSLPFDTLEPARKWINDQIVKGTMDCCYGFLTGGGVSIVNADSHESLMKLLLEYPESRFVDFEIHDLCDINSVFQEVETVAAGVMVR